MLSRLPQNNFSLGSIPLPPTLPVEQENRKINPMMGLGSPLKKPADKYAQPIAILSSKSTMALKSSAKLVTESNDIIDKITYLLQSAPQLNDGSISSEVSSLKTVIEKSYQTVENLKKDVDTVTKKQSSQDVLNDLNKLSPRVQDAKTNIVESNKKLSTVLENLFELPVLTINPSQINKLFANQIYVASDELKGKIIDAQKQYNDLSNQFFQYNGEAKTIKKDFDSLWKDKETKSDEIADKINSLNLLKNEKMIPLQQKMKNRVEPLWSLAVDKQRAFIEKVDNSLQGISDEVIARELTNLKSDSEDKFKEINDLHQEYQSKMPSNKLLSELFDKKQKETNVRLGEIMLKMYTFSEHQEKQLKKITV